LPGRYNLWTIALLMVAALLIGFVASTLAYRYRILRLPREPVVARMDRELHLTPAQRSQIRDIMKDTRLKIMQSERDFRRQRRAAFLQAMQEIRGTLTPEQQEKFDREFLPYGSRPEFGQGRDGGPPQDTPQQHASPGSGG
jgi:Spy/CpxP family protein refolding chaperone